MWDNMQTSRVVIPEPLEAAKTSYSDNNDLDNITRY